MKNQKLVFGGVMAAILFGVGTSNAVTLTSKDYVDRQVGAKADKSAVEALEAAKKTTLSGFTPEQEAEYYPTISAVKAAMPVLDEDDRAAIDAAKDLSTLTQTVSENAAEIEKLTGGASDEGSVAHTIAKTLESANYVTSDDLPTVVSQLANDAGYQTETDVSTAIETATTNFVTKDVDDLENYTTTTVLERDYALKDDLPTAVSQLTNDAGYQTESDVSTAIETATANMVTKDVNDLTNYTTTATLNGKLGALAELADPDHENMIAILDDTGQYMASDVSISQIPVPQEKCSSPSTVCVLATKTTGGFEWIAVTKDDGSL